MNPINQNLRELDENGWTIVKGVLSSEQKETAMDYFWEWLASLGSGIESGNLESWSDENWPGDVYSGSISSHGISQSQFVWYLRSRPSVVDVFMQIWEHKHPKSTTKGLLCSMDSIVCWRPWWYCDFEDWEPKASGLHLDQNPNTKVGFHCVQGLLLLTDVTETTGGFKLVPKTHLQGVQDILKPYFKSTLGDRYQLPETMPELSVIAKNARLVKGKAGDLILWDSRTIHEDSVGVGLPWGSKPTEDEELIMARLGIPVCMMPREGILEEILEERKSAYLQRRTMDHWANELNIYIGGDSHGVNISQEPPFYELSQSEMALL